MPLVLLAVATVVIAVLWALLLPLALMQRYRAGRMRRRAVPWAVGVNAVLLSISAAIFLAGAWLAGGWIEGAFGYAMGGTLAGVMAGLAGLWLTRFEWTQTGLYYTPNRGLVLALTLLVAIRIALGAWQFAGRWLDLGQAAAWAALRDQASLFTVIGVLLGHYLAYAWGLRRRTRLRR